MSPKDADRMANSVDPDQTAPIWSVWSGSALFAKICLSENLGSLKNPQDCPAYVKYSFLYRVISTLLLVYY